jgi:DHA1 family multidrug resistance protein-like MFS transporter
MRLTELTSSVPRRALVLSGGILTLSVVYFMIVPLLALYLSDEMHSSPRRIGVILSVLAVSNQGLQVFVGVLSDRWSTRTVLSLGVFAVCLGFVGFATVPPFPLQLGCALALGVGTAATSLLGKAMLAEAAGGQRVAAFALRAAAVNVGAAAGPVVGALVFGWFRAALLATAGVYAAFWYTVVRTAPSQGGGTGENPKLLGQLRTLFGNRLLVSLTLTSTGFWYLYTQLTFTFPLYADDRFALAGRVGVLFTVEALIAVVLQYPAITWLGRHGDGWRMLALGCALLAVAFLILATVPAAWALLLFIVVFALGSLLIVPTLDLLAADLSGTTTLAGALGVVSIGWAGGGLLGSVLGGVGYQTAKDTGHFGLFWLSAAAVAAVTGVAFLLLNRCFLATRRAEPATGADPHRQIGGALGETSPDHAQQR